MRLIHCMVLIAINTVWGILYQGIRELFSVYVHIYIYWIVVSLDIFGIRPSRIQIVFKQIY